MTSYLSTLRRQWTLVLLVVGLVGLAAAGWTLTRSPVYETSTKMFVSVRTDDDNVTDLSQGSTFTQERVKSYTSLLVSPPLLNEVIAQLGLTVTASELASRVSAANPPDSVLLEVTVRDGQAQRAADIANAIAGEFPAVVDKVEAPSAGATSPVKVSVTNPALAPAEPSSPHVKLNLGLGLLVGLGLGVALAVFREQSNTTIRTAADVVKLTGAAPLGSVPFDANAQKYPLVDTMEAAERAEAFRTLRTALQFVDVDNPPRVIVVSSALPAEGKTSTACNLALSISLSGVNVVLVDGDLRKPSVSRYLGISNAVGLTSVLAGQHDLRDVLVQYRHEALQVLPAGRRPPNPAEVLGSQQMTALLARLASEFDVVIVDAPPLLPVTDAAVLTAQADGTVFVARYGTSRREEMARALEVLSAVRARVLGTVLNRVPAGRVGTYGTHTSFDAAVQATPARGIGRLDLDDYVSRPSAPAAATGNPARRLR